MAEEIERLLVRVEANAVQFENQMRKINKVLYGAQADTRKTLNQIQRDTAAAAPQLFKPIGDSFKREMAGLATALAATFSAQQIVQYADAWTAAANKLAAAGVATSDLAARQEDLVKIANASRTGAQETIALYSRLTIATQEMGASASDAMRLTELMNKAFQSSGSSTQEAASAALQLSQALASGVLQGDELRSLRENAPLLAKAIADAMGVSIGALKELGAEGKITSAVVMKAILAAGDSIEARFGATTMTVSQSLTILNNEIGKFVGQADSSLSATERMAQAIAALAGNLSTVADIVSVAATAIGATLATRAIGAGIAGFAGLSASVAVTNAQLMAFELQSGLVAGAMGRMSVGGVAAAGAMRSLSGAMAFFGGPVGLLITGLAVGVALLAMKAREASESMKAIKAASDLASTALDKYEEAARAAANASGEAKKLALEHAAAMRIDAAETVRNARAQLELARTRRAVAVAEQKKSEGFLDSAAGAMLASGPYAGAGQASVRSGRQAVVDRALNEEVAAGIEFAKQENRLGQIERDLRAGTYVVTPTVASAGSGKGRGASGPLEADLARQRELLGLQNEIELLRAQGNEDGARAKQRELDTINLTKQLSDAGVANARESAAAHVGAVATAEDAARGLGILWERNQKALEASEEGNRRANDLLLDRLGFEAELARLRGDPVAIRTKERELWIEERINALLAMRPDLNRQSARTIAETERGSLDVANRQGESNDRARAMARDFTDVLASDNWAEAAGRKFREAAFDNLEDLLTNLFSGITGGSGAGGNSIGSIIGSALKNMIPGFATGTSSAPGGPAYVHKGEMLVNLKKGTSVVPAHAVRAMGALAGRSQVQPMARAEISPIVRIDLAGVNGDATIRQMAAEAARTAYAEAVATSSKVVLAQQAQRQRYSR
ncbi:hypothetical protein D3C72_387210 [compost metagenome]